MIAHDSSGVFEGKFWRFWPHIDAESGFFSQNSPVSVPVYPIRHLHRIARLGWQANGSPLSLHAFFSTIDSVNRRGFPLFSGIFWLRSS